MSIDIDSFKQFILTPLGIYLFLFPLRLIGLTWLERRYGAYPSASNETIARDIAVMFLMLICYPIVVMVSQAVGVRAPLPFDPISLPLWARIALYLVVADFCHYWVHRLMHQPSFWRVHRWHHSPPYMGWSAGIRATVPDAILVNFAYVFAWPLLGPTSPRLELLLMVFVLLKNDWMHLNVNWRLRWLEWLVITPRYHHIHHSTDAKHHNMNCAVLFTIWDRLFGTYLDPESLEGKLEFGLTEKVPAPRLVAGI